MYSEEVLSNLMRTKEYGLNTGVTSTSSMFCSAIFGTSVMTPESSSRGFASEGSRIFIGRFLIFSRKPMYLLLSPCLAVILVSGSRFLFRTFSISSIGSLDASISAASYQFRADETNQQHDERMSQAVRDAAVLQHAGKYAVAEGVDDNGYDEYQLDLRDDIGLDQG